MSPLGLRSAKKTTTRPPTLPRETRESDAKPAKAPRKGCQVEKPAKDAESRCARSPRGVAVEKPKADIYTVMLALSFVAVVIACICLYAEMKAYDMVLKPR